MDSLFSESYEASRARFLLDCERLAPMWASSRLEAHQLKNFPDLSIDWLWAEPLKKENIVLISTAEHGIEGYVGSAMLKLFMDEFAPHINHETTGLLLVHAINPWGMKHHKRVTSNHVDLNRNFIYDGVFSPQINPAYDTLLDFLSPDHPVRSLSAETLPFYANAIRYMVSPGKAKVQEATLLGQHRDAQGVYYGGMEYQEETIVLMELYRQALAEYQNFIQVDIHTGYGPRYQMSVIIPPLDPTSSSEAMREFNYPLVQKIDADEFYAISGDMGEYIYRLRDAEFPSKNVFACGFEFGTYGDSLPALLRSLQMTILENQLRHHGAVSPRAEKEILADYEEMFLPSEAKWRKKAQMDGRLAFKGILKAHNLL